MSRTEDWKGEHLIRGIKPSSAERVSEGNGIVSRMWNKRRRAAGIRSPGWQQHRTFVTGCGLARKDPGQ